jgi:hypothetical protein
MPEYRKRPIGLENRSGVENLLSCSIEKTSGGVKSSFGSCTAERRAAVQLLLEQSKKLVGASND